MSTISAVKTASPVVAPKTQPAPVPASAPAVAADTLQLTNGRPTLQQVLQLQGAAHHQNTLGALGLSVGLTSLFAGALLGLAGPLVAVPCLVLGAAGVAFGIYHMNKSSSENDQVKLLKTQLPRP